MISFRLDYFIEWMYHTHQYKVINTIQHCTFNKEKESDEINRCVQIARVPHFDRTIEFRWNAIEVQFFVSNDLKWMKSGKLMNNKWSITVESKEELPLNLRGTIWLKSTHFLRLIHSLPGCSLSFFVYFSSFFFILWFENYRFSNEINNSAIRTIILGNSKSKKKNPILIRVKLIQLRMIIWRVVEYEMVYQSTEF